MPERELDVLGTAKDRRDGGLDQRIGDLQTELLHDFFDGFVVHAGANLHARVLYGRSNHHKIEGIFKCFGRALRFACSTDARMKDQLPSTKGLLEKAGGRTTR